MSKVASDKLMSKKILIVEDEPSLLETLAYNLNREGYEVESTDNGLEALKIAGP